MVGRLTAKTATMRLLLAAGAALALLSGCKPKSNEAASSGTVSGGASGKAVKIGFIVKQPEEQWFQSEWRFAQKCADKYHFDLLKIGATDGEKALSAIDTLAGDGAQGFVICTPDVRLGPAIMAKAKADNLKVFSVDDQFVGSDGKFMDVPYMGISASKIGEEVGNALAAEYKKRKWDPKVTAACDITHDELNTVKERTDGAAAALIAAGFPANRIYRGAERTTDVPGAFDAANVVLTQHADVKNWLVFSVNDESVIGAIRAMENRGFGANNVIGVGIGGSVAFAEMEKPKATGFFATCLISPLRHGYETTEYMYKWITEGKEPPKVTYTKGTIVTRDTYKKVAQEEGLMDEAPAKK
jgi:L-arabinose transport system substrate-binding protein